MKAGNDKNLNANSALLKQTNLKVTPTRLAVLDLFNSSSTPLSIRDITEMLSKKQLDMVTVYRTIHSFVDKRILRQVEMKHNHAHYELVKNHHHHLICQDCGKIVDIKNCNFKSIENQALEQSGFSTITEHSFEMFGLCASCGKKKRRT